MNDENPLIKDTVLNTLNAIIDSLQFISASLVQVDCIEEDAKIAHSTMASAADFIQCTKLAAEACYTQHLKEIGKNTGVIGAPSEGL